MEDYFVLNKRKALSLILALNMYLLAEQILSTKDKMSVLTKITDCS